MDYKLVISSNGQDLDDMVDKFGRCSYFIVPEIEQGAIKTYQAWPNPSQNQSGGAGIAAAQHVLNENPKAVLTTRIGMKAMDVFNQAGLDVYQATGTVEDAIMDYLAGKLTPATVMPNQGLGQGQGRGMGGGRAMRP